ncbi:RipA family octameric membrane protein [Aliiglaciecola lipolytica]|uniref:Small integral membrane protein n=1 Tax=Aliiglaciecola lipolytica E3 TaxID=1127673 RepID=K6XRC7_9ALTE|nr:hypothetical protein [Aliiglaciecola lipolytica]GAC14241.1 hypothetical protein GLIP_1607 [Aliiglaciecola lipolytica E3]
MKSSEINDKLYSGLDPAAYDANSQYKAHLFEQYKIYLASTENISNRRQTANAFFVSLNAALVSLLSYLSLGNSNSFWVVAIVGATVSYMWYRLVRSYKDLNNAKFRVINEIEKVLPIRPYNAEWEAVGKGEKPDLYMPFTIIELYIPRVFMLLHIFVFCISVYTVLPQ